ncbi:aspartate-semialdehyde dehydrogenase [Salisediminibacterium halotolerans]|uniref:Aspartate-semialdehyde dehydrogenase n=1 Tax=Salisediminibacterium halotolerans TaxID=517425 RepID=A0A1H9Q9F7_9BACI|nr:MULTISPECIES: aspartate-semialdehyde dehydrogenase [Salisediminibacterium]RLJ74169.1 aspartate semialdehyde dehydrogenase [Actinophytocola xinjiangensis]RPE87738.1 aspartate semialdehyde dehydrogenase [Salisediminibacterium halotolerans]TWG35006.1 aspartate semialdehyde dehydrogenase [Salisediminibacterium halotolerans]SER57070.1 aspartate-semialdehyde dehydrogenase [Salisediminibacterium haloalkalitolerans]GEL06707.1 aspartate-semialdehyde dehydrogenase [Salisediminibacterium halotolerans]
MSEEAVHVAVLGATGAVGKQMLETLDRHNFPLASLKLLSSKRSAGKTIEFRGQTYTVEEATPESFDNVDLALFSAGGSVSKALAQEAVNRGAVVVDNTSAFRMDPTVPLVVPEVNENELQNHNGIIANPNCSTIQMVAALEPIRQKAGLKRVIVSTYQAVSGAGNDAVDEMYEQTQQILNKEPIDPQVLPVGSDKKHYQIAFNAVPQIDVFQDNGYTFEEMKMVNETKKIMNDAELSVAATCVRLPVETGHSESVYIETESADLTAEQIKELMTEAPGITLQDDPSQQVYPLASDAHGKEDIFVGRIRKDLDDPCGFHFWVVADNLLKGAALNSVQIAQSLLKMGLLQK